MFGGWWGSCLQQASGEHIQESVGGKESGGAQHPRKRTSRRPQSLSARQPSRWPGLNPSEDAQNSASRNFLAQVRKFKIAGIQSEATTIAATIWPSSGACTVADISTFGLGRPVGPAKFEGWKFCHCPSTTAWPFCCSCGCGFWLYASDVEFSCLCLEISTSGQHPSAWQLAGCLAAWLAGSLCMLVWLESTGLPTMKD